VVAKAFRIVFKALAWLTYPAKLSKKSLRRTLTTSWAGGLDGDFMKRVDDRGGLNCRAPMVCARDGVDVRAIDTFET
jgi:hypothetical protein